MSNNTKIYQKFDINLDESSKLEDDSHNKIKSSRLISNKFNESLLSGSFDKEQKKGLNYKTNIKDNIYQSPYLSDKSKMNCKGIHSPSKIAINLYIVQQPQINLVSNIDLKITVSTPSLFPTK